MATCYLGDVGDVGGREGGREGRGGEGRGGEGRGGEGRGEMYGMLWLVCPHKALNSCTSRIRSSWKETHLEGDACLRWGGLGWGRPNQGVLAACLPIYRDG